MTRLPPLLALAPLLIGCGGEPRPAPPPRADDASRGSLAEQVPPSGDGEAVTFARRDVPADVFFADPFAVLADDTPVSGAASPRAVLAAGAAGAEVMPESEVTGGPVAAEAAASSEDGDASTDWATLLPPDQLDEQVKAVLARLEDRTRDVGTYNNAYLEIPPQAAELAALFAVGGRVGGVPWADNAAALSEKAFQITDAGFLRRGAGGHRQVSDPLKTIDALLNGGGRATDAEPGEFADTTDFDLLMKRFQAGTDSLKSLASSPALLSANQADVAREARVLALLSAVTNDESHGWSFDESFKTMSRVMTDAALATSEAAESGDFDAFDAARRALGQTCSNCHGEFRN